MKNYQYLLWFTIGVALSRCIGEDVLDDEPVSAQLTINADQMALRVGESVQFLSSYQDEFGQPATPVVDWMSTNPSIVSINPDGLATAIAEGQVTISAAVGSVQSNQVLLAVVEDDQTIASIVLDNQNLTLQIGGTTTVQAQALNVNGEVIPDAEFTWASDNNQVAVVDGSGTITAVANGTAKITARSGNITSAALVITVGESERTGTFQGRSGYRAEGSAVLFLNNQNQLILQLSNDFNTDFALGTFIYLSNTTTGTGTRSNGLELGEITSDGAATFNVTAISAETGLQDFRYVIVLCKPASITFGVADLEN